VQYLLQLLALCYFYIRDVEIFKSIPRHHMNIKNYQDIFVLCCYILNANQETIASRRRPARPIRLLRVFKGAKSCRILFFVALSI
jgi:hypothetical protein